MQMVKGKCKTISNRSQNTWASSEPSSPTTASPEYTNILSNQETIIAKLNKNNNTPKETDVKEIVAEEKIESSTPNIIEAVNNREPSANQIKCPHCGNIQSNNIQRCLRCSNLINE